MDLFYAMFVFCFLLCPFAYVWWEMNISQLCYAKLITYVCEH